MLNYMDGFYSLKWSRILFFISLLLFFKCIIRRCFCVLVYMADDMFMLRYMANIPVFCAFVGWGRCFVELKYEQTNRGVNRRRAKLFNPTPGQQGASSVLEVLFHLVQASDLAFAFGITLVEVRAEQFWTTILDNISIIL